MARRRCQQGVIFTAPERCHPTTSVRGVGAGQSGILFGITQLDDTGVQFTELLTPYQSDVSVQGHRAIGLPSISFPSEEPDRCQLMPSWELFLCHFVMGLRQFVSPLEGMRKSI
jgi:hypothetical protein